MTDIIHNICIALGAKPPKVVEYSNGTLVVIRNGDGARVATIASIPMDCSYKTIVGMLKSMGSK